MVEEVENGFNPFASPASPSVESEFLPPTRLPFVFRPPIASYVIAVPSGLACTLVATMALFSTMSPTGDALRSILLSILITITAAIGAVGCLGIFWSKIKVTDDSIEKLDLSPKKFRFDEINKWGTSGNYVRLKIKQTNNIIHLHNWAMSRKNCQRLIGILNDKVGPPTAGL